MSRRLGHPSPEALASFRAGLVSGGRNRRLSAHVSRCPRCAVMCARLDAVAAALAAAPVPVLPPAVECRVIARLHAESPVLEARTRPPGTPRPGAMRPGAHYGTMTASPPPAPGPVPGLAAKSKPNRLVRSTVPRVATTACLLALLASLGYLARGTGLGAGSSAQAMPSPSALTPSSSPAGRGTPATHVPAAGPKAHRGLPGNGPVSSVSHTTAFLVTDTQTHYRRSTLRAQVRDRLAGQASVPAAEPIQPAITPVAPASSDSGTTALPAARPSTPGSSESTSVPVEVIPSTSLVACVLHLTGDVPPEFVDRATYQARPAYIFAVADEIWVVGVDCTAARPAVITAVRISNAS